MHERTSGMIIHPLVGILLLVGWMVMGSLATTSIPHSQHTQLFDHSGGGGSRSLLQVTQPPAVIRLGCMFQFTYPSTVANVSSPPYDPAYPLPITSYHTQAYGPSVWAVFKFQLARLNNRTDILPRTQLICDLYDDQLTSASRGFFGALQLIQNGAKVLIGPSASSPAANAALVAGQYSIPQISYAASAASLSDRSQYPTLLRVCPSDAYGAYALAHLSAFTFKWTKAAVLHGTDLFGLGGATEFISAAQSFNISILAQVDYSAPSSDDDMMEPLERIKESGARIILFWGQAKDWVFVSGAAASLGMFNNVTVWMGPSLLISNGPITPAVRARSLGLIALAPTVGAGTPGRLEFQAAFSARDPIDHDNVVEQYNGTLAQMNQFAYFAADTATVVATALHELLEVQHLYDFTPQQLHDQIKRTRLINAASGNVSFDAGGERIGVTFGLYSIVNATFINRGTWADNVWTPDPLAGPIVWADGTTNVPLDAPLPVVITPEVVEPIQYSHGAYLTFLIIPSFFLAVLLLTGVMLWWGRSSRVIYAASPVMMATILLGCLLLTTAALLSAFLPSITVCRARDWIWNYGFICAFGSILLKQARLHRVLNNRELKNVQISDWQLLKALFAMIAFDTILLAVEFAIEPDSSVQVNNVCSRFSSTTIGVIIWADKGVIFLAAVCYCYLVRNLPQLYNESRFLALAVYTDLLLWIAELSVRYGLDTPTEGSQVLFNTLLLIEVAVLILCVYVPKGIDLIRARIRSAEFRSLREGEAAGRKLRLKTLMALRAEKKKQEAVAAAAEDDERMQQLDLENGSVLPSDLQSSVPSLPASNGTGPGTGIGPGPAPGTVRSGPSASATRHISDIFLLLASVQADNERRMKSLFVESQRLRGELEQRKRDIAATRDTLYQIRCEMEFYTANGVDLEDEQVMNLFFERMNQLCVPSEISIGSTLEMQSMPGAAPGAPHKQRLVLGTVHLPHPREYPQQRGSPDEMQPDPPHFHTTGSPHTAGRNLTVGLAPYSSTLNVVAGEGTGIASHGGTPMTPIRNMTNDIKTIDPHQTTDGGSKGDPSIVNFQFQSNSSSRHESNADERDSKIRPASSSACSTHLSSVIFHTNPSAAASNSNSIVNVILEPDHPTQTTLVDHTTHAAVTSTSTSPPTPAPALSIVHPLTTPATTDTTTSSTTSLDSNSSHLTDLGTTTTSKSSSSSDQSTNQLDLPPIPFIEPTSHTSHESSSTSS